MIRKIILNVFLISMFFTCSATFASEIYLTDINEHWAKENIIKLIENNVISGYGDNTFRPNENITIIEFLKMIIEAGDYKLVREGRNVYPDFYISTAQQNKLIIDVKDNDYSMPISRYQAVDVISNFIDLDNVKESKNIFKDIDGEYKNKISKLVKLKVITGYTDKTFRGNNNITRAEAATIINRAIQNRRDIISNNKESLLEDASLSNYGKNNKKGEFAETRYEIVNNKLIIHDNGRYSKNLEYEVNGELIDINKVNKLINKIINKDSYTLVTYIPSKYTINQLKISHGESENLILENGEDFSFTYYEDKPYELSRISMHEEFSNDCYLKIEVLKLWKDYSEFLSGNYIDEYKKEKLFDALKIEFGSNYASKILNYIISKNKLYVSNQDREKEYVEKKIFGKYIINFYQKEYGKPEFYISKK